MAANTARRTASREQRREQLIAATMKCIARKGLSSMTLGDVAREAGLSQGIVNLHFESKENLLKETLRHLADDYKAQFREALDESGPGAADKLRAVLVLDLQPSVIDREKLAIWFAFWGEVKSRPTYRRICGDRDRFYDSAIENLCEEIITEGKYEQPSSDTASLILKSITDGMWLSFLVSPRTFDRKVATQAIDDMLRNLFPNHYN